LVCRGKRFSTARSGVRDGKVVVFLDAIA